MKKVQRFLTVSSILLSGVSLVFALTFCIAAPSAHAESPDVLAGQNMSIGSSGPSVVVLQGLLSELGYLHIPAGTSAGYYGSLTAQAVGRYQAALNVYPTAGNYGPLTKVAMHTDFSAHGWLKLLGWND
jgi:peptidoglycan hydrolase-like protein with peptidoglycan-binding domain